MKPEIKRGPHRKKILRPVGVLQFRILKELERTPGLSGHQIAVLLGCSRFDTSERAVEGLLQREYVCLMPSAENNMVLRYFLTKKGQALLTEAQK